MEKKPIIVVFGATGAQGGSVVKYLRETNKYHIRGVTRNPSSSKSQQLEKQGVEIVKADMGKKPELQQAFKDAFAIFCVTNFWDPEIQKNHKLEVTHGKNVTDVAIQMKVKHLIFSTLPDVDGISKGKIKVPHCTQKNHVERYMRSHKNEINSVFVSAGCYFSNFGTLFKPQVASDGTAVFRLPISPTAKIAFFDPDDTGKYVQKILENIDEMSGKTFYMTSGEITVPMVADTFSKVTGKKAKFEQMDPNEFRKLAGEELTEMLKWFEEFGLYGPKVDLSESLKMVPATSCEEWFRKNDLTIASE